MSLLLEAALLGVVQGLTEFLPVSSSAHLILARSFFGWNAEQFGLPFDVACHVGTLTAILVYFQHDLRDLLNGLPHVFTPGSDPAARQALVHRAGHHSGGPGGRPAGRRRSTPPGPRPSSCVTLGVGGVLMAVAERAGAQQRQADSLGLLETLAVGVAQACALVPGVSRSGATITMGMFLGLTRESAARFSFVLGVPAMLGAATLEGAKLAMADVPMDAMTTQVFVVGMVVSAVVGYLTVRFFLRYLVHHTLNAFVAYRLALAAVTLAVAGVVMLAWLRRRFITGFFVTVPLIVSVAALVWGFGVVDGVTAPLTNGVLGRDVPGLGLLTGALAVLMVGRAGRQRDRPAHPAAAGALAAAGARVSHRLRAGQTADRRLFTRQRNGLQAGRACDAPARGLVMGFLTREFVLADPAGQARPMAAVYVPTNHLYLGDVLIFPRHEAAIS